MRRGEFLGCYFLATIVVLLPLRAAALPPAAGVEDEADAGGEAGLLGREVALRDPSDAPPDPADEEDDDDDDDDDAAAEDDVEEDDEFPDALARSLLASAALGFLPKFSANSRRSRTRDVSL